MYKHYHGVDSTGNGGVLCIVGSQLVGSHERTSDHDHYPEGFGDGERGTLDVS
jgi:hypothetical protein